MRRFQLVLVGFCLASSMLAVSPDRLSATLGWDDEQTLSDPISSASWLDFALSADGTTAVAAWSRASGGTSRVEVSVASIQAGTATWSTPVQLSAAGQSAGGAQVALSADGATAIVVWFRYDGFNNIIQASVGSPRTGTWEAPQNLSAAGQNAEDQSVAINGAGTKAIVAWRRFSGGFYWFPQRSVGTIAGGVATWGAVSTFSPQARSTVGAPQVAVAQNGLSGGVAWHYDSAPNVIQASIATTSALSAFSADTTLSTDPAYSVVPRLSIENGVAVSTWSQETGGGNHQIKSSTALLNSNPLVWSAPVNVSANGQPAWNASVDLDSSAALSLATWRRSNGTHFIAQAVLATVANGVTTWGTVTDLSAVGQSVSDLDAAIAGNGQTAGAVWRRTDNAGIARVQFSRAVIAAGIPQWTAPVDISSAGANAMEPVIGLADDSSVGMAAWLAEVQPGTWAVRSRVLFDRPDPNPPLQASPPIVSLYKVSLDPRGGACVVGGVSHGQPWTEYMLGYGYLPGPSDCSRLGFELVGWADHSSASTALRLPFLIDPRDERWRWFIADNYSLVSVWRAVPASGGSSG